MNILVTANCFPPKVGGTEVYSHEVSLGLAHQKDTRVIVLAPYCEGAPDWDGESELEIYRYRSSWARVVLFFKLLRSGKINRVLVTHRSHFLSLACIAKAMFSIPFWVVLHGTEYFGPDKAEKIVTQLSKAQKVVAVSSFVRKQTEDKGLAPAKIVQLPPPINTKKFLPNLDVSPLKQNLGLKNETVFLTAARLVPEKGIDQVITAMSKVRDRLPLFQYYILGEGKEEVQLKNLVEKLGMQDCIHFLGAIPHDALFQQETAYMNLPDVFVLTSTAEPFGIVYTEAGACGKPVIAYASGGVVDIIDHEQTGLLVEPGNIDALAEALVNITSDPEKARKMGTAGRAKIVQEFDTQILAKRLWAMMVFHEI